MIKSKFKRVTSLFLATLMCVTTFAGIGSTTAYAASGEKADVYMVDFPRDGDANYDGVWGHSNLTLKNGWHTGRFQFYQVLRLLAHTQAMLLIVLSREFRSRSVRQWISMTKIILITLQPTGLFPEMKSVFSLVVFYSMAIVGQSRHLGGHRMKRQQTALHRLMLHSFLSGRTVIGERDANFNHVAASGCSNVKDVINAKHPLRNKIFSYYNSMVQSVQNHATIPSFCNKSSGSAKTIELEWNGKQVHIRTLDRLQ